jgi:hypothetical protein
MQVSGTVKRALMLASRAAVVFDLARLGIRAAGQGFGTRDGQASDISAVLQQFEILVAETPSKFAEEEEERQFATVHANTLVSVWATLEVGTVVDDLDERIRVPLLSAGGQLGLRVAQSGRRRRHCFALLNEHPKAASSC